MSQVERQQSVKRILQDLRDLEGLKRLFWEELNYDRENRPLSMRGWPDSTREALAEDPILFASGGEGAAFHILYCRIGSKEMKRGSQRPVVTHLIREHPYALFVFSNRPRSEWHFLNVKLAPPREGEDAQGTSGSRRRLFRRITVRPGSGLRTAAERLQLLDLDPLESDSRAPAALQIQQRHDEAFDVEQVSRDFYREIANWYFWALKLMEFPKDAPKEQDGRDHISVIRLITRLIFCWFMKEKGLIPSTLFDARELDRELAGFEPTVESNEDSVYYRAIIQNLFFATLNTEMDNRGWTRKDQNFMAHSLYRFKDYFCTPRTALALFQDIPFLNGGLFECLDKDLGKDAHPRYVRIDGFSRRPDSQVTAPDFLFFGRERELDLCEDYGDRKHRKVRTRGLINTLNRYKFTIEENTPLDQEVALDPELCGKVFENLLAAYNPETGTTARKATGSFYTPREIVDYMVDESLLAYFKSRLEKDKGSASFQLAEEGSSNGEQKTENSTSSKLEDSASRDARAALDPPEQRLRALLGYDAETHDFDENETQDLIEAIDEIKVLDPAVGSGAFPMGVLHKLVHVLAKLDRRNEKWKERQIARVRAAIEEAEKIEDTVFRERSVEELEQQIANIEDAFERNELDYGRKLYLIENCIYGVDIQPIAVQIAKMRFFISLIVDQRVDPSAPNLGVRALPNLETKFVAADTLIGIERKAQQADFFTEDTEAHIELKRLRQRLTDVRHRHFTARTNATKAKYRQEDRDLREGMSTLLERAGMTAAISRQFAAWDPYDQNASAGFFDSEWMFGAPDGFDIVIGNPPYVRIQTLPAVDVSWLKQHYKAAAKGNFDLYVVFVERGLQLLQEQGQLAFILPHKFFNAQYGAALRALLAEGRHLRHVVHFGDQQVFPGATNYVCLLFLAKTGTEECRFVRADDIEKWLTAEQGTESDIPVSRVTGKEWNFAVGKGAGLFGRLQSMPVTLGSLASRISQGIRTSANEVYVLDVVSESSGLIMAYSKQLARKVQVEKKAVLQFLQGREIKAYSITPSGKVVVMPYRWADGRMALVSVSEYRSNFPRAWEYLEQNKHHLEERENGRMTHNQWYGFVYPKNLDVMMSEKLLVPDIANRAAFAFDETGAFSFTSGYGVILKPSVRVSPKYLMALLNSRLLDTAWKQVSTPLRGGFYRYFTQFLEQLPIFPVDFANRAEGAEHDALVELVDRILAAKKVDPAAETSAWGREIDERVYRLYGLTAEEIRIVEGENE